MSTEPAALQLWREIGGVDRLLRLDEEPVTPGMVVVARAGDDHINHPELRFQVWPDLLVPMSAGVWP